MKKLILFSIIILFYISFVNAEPSFLFKQSEQVDLRISCFDTNDQPCNSSTSCYITVFKPNSDILIENKTMSYNPTYYNYSLNSTQTTDLGDYSAVVYCSGVVNDYTKFDYKITRGGKELSTGESTAYLILTFALLFCFLLSLYINIRIPYFDKKNMSGEIIQITHTKYLKIWMILITYGLFTWFLNTILGLSDNYVDLGIFYGFANMMFTIVINLVYPLFVLIFVWTIIEWVRDINKKKLINLFGST